MTDARARTQEYLLERRLFRRLSSGEVIEPKWTRFTFPTIWQYDVLRGLDYLRSAGVKPDETVLCNCGIGASTSVAFAPEPGAEIGMTIGADRHTGEPRFFFRLWEFATDV